MGQGQGRFVIKIVHQDYSRTKYRRKVATLERAVGIAKRLKKTMKNVRWFECMQYNETLKSGVIIIEGLSNL